MRMRTETRLARAFPPRGALYHFFGRAIDRAGCVSCMSGAPLPRELPIGTRAERLSGPLWDPPRRTLSRTAGLEVPGT